VKQPNPTMLILSPDHLRLANTDPAVTLTPSNPEPSTQDEWEYLLVEVSRSESTELYLKVPKGWRPSGRDSRLLGKAASDTTRDSDWDNYGWEQCVEVQGCQLVDAKEAEQYQTFDVRPHLLNAASTSKPVQ
jgi:hypothetical protein